MLLPQGLIKAQVYIFNCIYYPYCRGALAPRRLKMLFVPAFWGKRCPYRMSQDGFLGQFDLNDFPIDSSRCCHGSQLPFRRSRHQGTANVLVSAAPCTGSSCRLGVQVNHYLSRLIFAAGKIELLNNGIGQMDRQIDPVRGNTGHARS